jgi:peptidoglycan/LPS O-acetylase OafA/YrhL
VLWALRVPRRAMGLLIFAAVLAVIWRMQMQAIAPGIEQRIAWAEHAPGRSVQFVAGAVMALALRRSASTTAPSGWRTDAGALMAITALVLLPLLPSVWGDAAYNGVIDARAWTWAWPLLVAMPAGVLVWSAARGGGLVARRLAAAPLRFLGTVSFSLYLWHYPVQWWLRSALGGYVPPEWGLAGFTAASLALSLLVATVSWWLVERPTLAAARRWADGRRAKLRAP